MGDHHDDDHEPAKVIEAVVSAIRSVRRIRCLGTHVSNSPKQRWHHRWPGLHGSIVGDSSGVEACDEAASILRSTESVVDFEAWHATFASVFMTPAGRAGCIRSPRSTRVRSEKSGFSARIAI